MNEPMPVYKPKSTVEIRVEKKGAKAPALTVGKQVTVEAHGTVEALHHDEHGYSCTIRLSGVTFGGQAPKSLSDQLKAAKHGKAEETAEGE